MAGQDEHGPPRPMAAEREASGPVEAANERGIKVAGAWYDFGNFYEGERPTVGQEVELVATGRYLRSVKIDGRAAGGAAPRAAGGSGAAPPAPWDPDDSFAGLGAPGAGAGPRALRQAPAPAGRPGAPARAVLTPEERAQDRRERRRLACLATGGPLLRPPPGGDAAGRDRLGAGAGAVRRGAPGGPGGPDAAGGGRVCTPRRRPGGGGRRHAVLGRRAHPAAPRGMADGAAPDPPPGPPGTPAGDAAPGGMLWATRPTAAALRAPRPGAAPRPAGPPGPRRARSR